VRQFLKENREMAQDIEQRIRADMLPKPKSAEVEEEAVEA
jgi:hypothetical protein